MMYVYGVAFIQPDEGAQRDWEAETTDSGNALNARVRCGSTSLMYLVQLSDSLLGRAQRDRGSRDHIQRQCA